MSQLNLFTLPECPCGMGPFPLDGAVELWCACGVEQFADVGEYLDWLASEPEQEGAL